MLYIKTPNGFEGSLFPTLSVAILAVVLYSLLRIQDFESRRKTFERKHGCKPPASVLKGQDPFGILFMMKALAVNKKHNILGTFRDMHRDNGRTFVNYTWRRTVYFSNDPENIKAALSTNFDDWAIKELRQEAVKELLGDGIFTTDGAFWAHSRAMLRPAFEKSQVADLEQFETHMEALIELIPKDGSTVDLQDIFHKLSMDASTELLTGTSTGSLKSGNAQGKAAEEFVENFEYGMDDGTSRARLGRIYYLVPRPKAWKAIKHARQFVDHYVEKAMEVKNNPNEKSDKDGKGKGKFVFLEELAKHEEVDATRIRNETLNILLAGRDTTASLLSCLWFMLARRPDVWEKLQAEVDELGGELPTYERLRDMKYIKYCAQETLRLFPPVPILSKKATRDTFLPHGGGLSGEEPIFVPKGAVFVYNTNSMMREEASFGSDAAEWRPERWGDSSLRPGWAFLPFGGGPRVCLGQQYALTETYYVTIRLMQHFRKIESRDQEPWLERLTVTCCSFRGTQVGLCKE